MSIIDENFFDWRQVERTVDNNILLCNCFNISHQLYPLPHSPTLPSSLPHSPSLPYSLPLSHSLSDPHSPSLPHSHLHFHLESSSHPLLLAISLSLSSLSLYSFCFASSSSTFSYLLFLISPPLLPSFLTLLSSFFFSSCLLIYPYLPSPFFSFS